MTEPNLHTHIIGFPYNANSNNNDMTKNDKDTLDNLIYEPLYELSNEYLRNGYSILYLVESLPTERKRARIVEDIQYVKKGNNKNTDDTRNNISKGLMTVIDSKMVYKENASGRDIVDFLLSNTSEMHRRLQEKTKGTMIFNAPDQFFSRGKYDVFMDFEEKISRALPDNVGLLCWYKRKWLSNLSFAHVIDVLVDHKYTIHSNQKYKQWDTNKINDLVSKGIDNNLGEGSSTLLFQTMKSAYKLKPESIVNKPAIFEETLKRVLGKDDANSVINSIFEEIIKEVEFSLTGNSSNK